MVKETWIPDPVGNDMKVCGAHPTESAKIGVICGRELVVGCRLKIGVNLRSSAVDCQLSVPGCQFPVERQLLVAGCRLKNGLRMLHHGEHGV